MVKRTKPLSWEDDLGEYETLRFEAVELPDDEIRRVWYGNREQLPERLEKSDEDTPDDSGSGGETSGER